jgi:hypothetical protein
MEPYLSNLRFGKVPVKEAGFPVSDDAAKQEIFAMPGNPVHRV